MAEFAYNNTKNASISHIPLKLNCGYLLRVSFKDNVNPHSRSYSLNELAKELRKLIEICYQNILYA